LISELQKTATGIVKYQDPSSGLWWQVLDQGSREGNYLEATASAMFVYSLAKGVNQGYLSRDYVPTVLRGFGGITSHLIKTDSAGRTCLTHCCSVAGLGYGRDGSFAYYMREPVVDNDLKGVGPFILAGIEVQKLLGLPMIASHDTGQTNAASCAAKEWAGLPEILARIKGPSIPDREFSIASFGAVADGHTDCTAAIARAIDTAAKADGGRVNIPAGDYFTGPIRLRSRVNLHLEQGATLIFTTDPKAYLPAVRTRFEGMECWNYAPLISAYEQEDIAITGEGLLDGQASDENWWSWKGRKDGTNNQTVARTRLAKYVAESVPVDERRFGEGDYLRPAFIEPHRCRNVLIEGVRIRRSPMWEVHPLLCTNVIVRGLQIESHGPNNDGCDPESCRDMLIEKTVFDTGDDCIAIKSGRNNDGRRVGIPTENVVIRDCTMKDGHGGVTIGSEISGGCSNVFVENCSMDSTNLDRVIRFKSNAVRGGVVQNVFVRNLKVGNVGDAALQIDFAYEEGAKGPYKPVVRNVVLESLNVEKVKRVLDVRGFAGAEISGVRIYNSKFQGISQPDRIEQAEVKLVDCVVEKAP
jgi:unsaturated rhamnogalacturonyl hydrolase